MPEELKPCPFCGFKAVYCEKRYNGVTHRYRVQCNNVGCQIRTPWMCYLDDAVEMWNKRYIKTNTKQHVKGG